MKEIWDSAVAKAREIVRSVPLASTAFSLLVGVLVGVLIAVPASSDDAVRERQAEQIAELRDEVTSSRSKVNSLRQEIKINEKQADKGRDVAKATGDDARPVARKPAPEPAPAPKPKPEPAPPSPRQKLRATLADVNAIGEDPDIKEIDFFGGETLNIVVETPMGGFQGPSTTDLNYMSRAIFESVYGPSAPQHKFATVIEFTGGLIDTRTGRESDALTARYMMERSEARDIAWSDKTTLDFINWSLYRTFTHPAIKDDD